MRRILPAAFLVAAVVALVVGVGELAILFALVAAFTVLADLWIRIAMSSQRDRDVEEDARERYAREGRWPDEPAPPSDGPRDPHRRGRPTGSGRRRTRR